jgi:hypothetical protein
LLDFEEERVVCRCPCYFLDYLFISPPLLSLSSGAAFGTIFASSLAPFFPVLPSIIMLRLLSARMTYTVRHCDHHSGVLKSLIGVLTGDTLPPLLTLIVTSVALLLSFCFFLVPSLSEVRHPSWVSVMYLVLRAHHTSL